MNAPANDVFDSKDPRGETVRLRKARRAFDDALSAARTDLEGAGGTPEIQTLIHDLDAIRTAMNAMASEANMTFSYFSIEAPEKAAPLMAGMHRRFATVQEAFSALEQHVRDVQDTLFQRELAAAGTVQQRELILALFVVLMIFGAIYYGRSLSQQAARRRDRALASARRAGGGARGGARSLAAQVGVPGQHEPRDPDADERRPRRDRARARDRAHRRAARVPRARQVVGRRAPGAPQRHPRLLEDRGRQARPRARAVRPPRAPRALGEDAGAARPPEGPRAGVSLCRPTYPTRSSATRAGSGRSSSTWSATPSSSPSAARSASAVRVAGAHRHRGRAALRGLRHRHRHPAPTSSSSSSRPSPRPTARPAGSSAAPVSASRSARSWSA